MRLAACDRCRFVKWVNTITQRGEVVGEFCADCFDYVPKDEIRRNRTIKSSGSLHNDPALDNAVRALEGD